MPAVLAKRLSSLPMGSRESNTYLLFMNNPEKSQELDGAEADAIAAETDSPKVQDTSRGFRFRLRTILVLTAFVGAYCAYEARIVQRSRYHRQMKKDIQDLGGYASCGSSDGRSELHKGDILYHWNQWHYESFVQYFDQYLDRITYVLMQGKSKGNADLAAMNLSSLPTLCGLNLNGSAITDDALRDVGKLSQLVELNLHNTAITDEGLRHLTGLENLRRLIISRA